MINKKMAIIDGVPVEIEGERNLVELCKKAGIELPTFCYHGGLSIYGACRMCMVEDDRGRLMAACSTIPKGGMKIKTNTLRLRRYRSLILELLLANHCRDCTTCGNSGDCHLQQFARRFDIENVRFPNEREHEVMLDNSSPSIVKDQAKCILCGDCVRICNEVQGVGAIDFAFRGSNSVISTAFGKPLSETSCVGCGQCATVCPTGAIIINDSTTPVWEAVDDPEVFVTCEVAPAVRVAIGNELGLEEGTNAIGKIVAALHRMGFDQVFDTTTGADLTVIEETNEFINRVENGGKLPLFTSCCPAWIQLAEKRYPEILDNISTCRSPMSMFGSVVKEYYKDKLPEGKKKHYHVAIMPCTAKKFEAKRPDFEREDGAPCTDDVLTTRELERMIKESGIRFEDLEPESIDMPFTSMSGAGVIFGVTGGVTEAVLRRVADDGSRTTLRALAYSGVRGMEGVKETYIDYKGQEVHIAVVSGLANAAKIIEKVKSGEAHYDLIEIMACPGGCVNGAGQPQSAKSREIRGKGLYTADQVMTIKRSQDNPIIKELYEDILKDNVHELLHTHYHER